MWYLFAILSGLGAAILAILIKLYLKQFNPFFLAFIFFFIAAIVFLMIGLITKKISPQLISSINLKQSIVLIIAGLINAFAFASYLFALNSGKVSTVVAIDRLGILYVIILSIVILKEAFSIKCLIGGLLMIIGVLLIN